MITERIVLSAGIAFATASGASAQSVTFDLIPEALSANDMSPDGRFIVGETGHIFPDGTYLYDRLTGVMTELPPEGFLASAVSDDGTVVLGNMADPDGLASHVAGIWTTETGWQSLGYLDICGSGSSGYELSADGSVAVGLSWDGCSGRGFIWDALNGMRELENLANGNNRASVVSADGAVIGGFAQGSFSRTPSMWNDMTAGMLLDPPSGDVLGEVHGISDDGSMLLVEWLDESTGDTTARAATWTAKDGIQVIGNGNVIPVWNGIPMDVSDNMTFVGFDNILTLRRAWIKTPESKGMVDFKTWVEDHGGVVPDNLILEVCQAISTDGTVIIGHGAGTGAWLVTIDNPCSADLSGDGVVDTIDLLDLLGEWGGCEDCPQDLNNDGIVDTIDLLDLLGAWGDCS